MPIRVTCQCGASLNIPDAMAGKSAKCPKCGKPLTIPQLNASGGSPKTPSNKTSTSSPPSDLARSGPTTKPAGLAAVPGAAVPGALEQLFADAGLDKQPAQKCPNCKTEITPGAALCVACGLNLTTGETLKGFKIAGEEEDEGPKFKDYRLTRAARSIKKEKNEEMELRFVGAPWWVYLAIVFGLITITVFGVIYVDGLGGEEGASSKASIKSFEGRVQRQPPQRLLIIVSFLVSSMVVMMATIAIQVKAFQRNVKSGFLTFIPGYAHYYSIAARKHLRSTTKILWIWTIVMIVFSVLLFISKGYKVFFG